MQLRRRMAARVSGVGLILALGLGQAAPASAEGAIVLHQCFTEPETVAGYTLTYCGDTVVTAGGIHMHFHGALTDPSTAPSTATTVTGFACFPPPDFYPTFDSRLVVTPNGVVDGTCAVRKS